MPNNLRNVIIITPDTPNTTSASQQLDVLPYFCSRRHRIRAYFQELCRLQAAFVQHHEDEDEHNASG